MIKTNKIEYDFLLVRGITPYQNLVIRNFRAQKTVLFASSSLKGVDMSVNFKLSFILKLIFYFMRIYQMRIFSEKVEFLVNSPGLKKEIKQVTSKSQYLFLQIQSEMIILIII